MKEPKIKKDDIWRTYAELNEAAANTGVYQEMRRSIRGGSSPSVWISSKWGEKCYGLVFENAIIVWSNVQGLRKEDIKTGRVFNNEGDSNFCILISKEEDISMLRSFGVNVSEDIYINETTDEQLKVYTVKVKMDLNEDIDPETGKERTDGFWIFENGPFGKISTRLNKLNVADYARNWNIDGAIAPYEKALVKVRTSAWRKNPGNGESWESVYLASAKAMLPEYDIPEYDKEWVLTGNTIESCELEEGFPGEEDEDIPF